MFEQTNNQKEPVSLCEDFTRVGCFNFKVLELKTTEDTDKHGENLRQERVRELFNFDFNLNLSSKEEEIDSTFAFSTRRNTQRLYLSKNTLRLMEIVNGLIAKIYERDEK